MTENGELPDPRWRVKTLQEVADWYDVSLQTVYGWRVSGCGGDLVGGFDLRAIGRWLSAKRNLRNTPADESTRAVQRSKLTVETEAKQFHLDIKRGMYVGVAAVRAEWDDRGSRIRARLEALAGEIAPGIPVGQRAEVAADIAEKVRMALTEISEYGWSARQSELPPAEADAVPAVGARDDGE